MRRQIFTTAVVLAAFAQAQTTIVVSDSSTQTNPIEVSSRPTDDVPNMSDATTSTTSPKSTAIETSTIPTVVTISLPIIPISSVSNHIDGNNTYTMPTTTVVTPSGSCVTVTMQGEPMFTIQTDTILESPCTYTVFAASGSVSTDVLTTTSTTGSSGGESTPATGTMTPAAAPSSSGTTSGTSAPATQSGNPANRVTMGAEVFGLAAFVGALGLL